jgi:transcriptional regulator with XRE-family HTH domain
MKLGDVLRKWRKMEDISVREAAFRMGLTTPTLFRLENGKPMDGSTLAKIINWLTSEKD